VRKLYEWRQVFLINEKKSKGAVSTQHSALSIQPNPLRGLCTFFATFAVRESQPKRKERKESAKVAKDLKLSAER
jgi:hypothetical protein